MKIKMTAFVAALALLWPVASMAQVELYTGTFSGTATDFIPPGTAMPDAGYGGAVYVGSLGEFPLFTTRCDAGMWWNPAESRCEGTSTPQVFGTPTSAAASLTDGQANTATLVGLGSRWAAQWCANLSPDAADPVVALNSHGFDDWYLPAQNELSKLYANKTQIGNFANTVYWSSTNKFHSGYWAVVYQHFANGIVSQTNQGYAYNVRCVRRGTK